MRSALIAASLGLLAGSVSAQASAWGQCGGQNWSGTTTCVSGYSCVVVNSYYSQCQPGGSGSTPTTSSAPSTGTGTSTGSTGATTAGPGTTLQSGYYWIRAVESPLFHYYLQSKPLLTASTAVLGSYTTAGQFQVVSGQLVQLISSPGATAQLLYGQVSGTAIYDSRALLVTWSTSQNTYGTWGWTGDGLTWSAANVTRQNSIAWYICGSDNDVYINLGAYLYNTPSGCTDETLHYYNDSHANNKRGEEEVEEEE